MSGSLPGEEQLVRRTASGAVMSEENSRAWNAWARTVAGQEFTRFIGPTIAGIGEALSEKFKEEREAMQEKVDALEKRIAELEEQVTKP